MAERDPCPGCGRPIAYRVRAGRRPSETERFAHKCPHGRACIAGWRNLRAEHRGDRRHWESCPECAAATILDCRRCAAPLLFDPLPFVEHCPVTRHGVVLVMGVQCPACGTLSAYKIKGERVARLSSSWGEMTVQREPRD